MIDIIKRMERIVKEEYHSNGNRFIFSYISGPKYTQWMSEMEGYKLSEYERTLCMDLLDGKMTKDDFIKKLLEKYCD